MIENPSSTINRKAASAWTNYWQRGHQETCFNGAHGFSAEDHWSDFFSIMPVDSRILDLATGSGAVLNIAAATSLKFRLHGVDQADIGTIGPGGSTLHPNITIESLPFDAASFDAITSQYGFEYSDTPATIQEIARVSAPAASLRLLIHAKDGEVYRSTSARLKRIETVMQGKRNFIFASREICERSPAYTPPPKLKKLEKKFGLLCTDMRKKFKDAPPDDAALYAVNYLSELVAHRHLYDPSDTLRCIAELNDDTKAYAFRIRSMLRAAQSEQDMLTIANQLAAAGFRKTRHALLRHGDHIVGWDLSAIFRS